MELSLTPAQRGALESLWPHFGQEGIAPPHYPPDVVRTLRLLQDEGEELAPDAAIEWAREAGWQEKHALELGTYAMVVRYWGAGGPLAPDTVETWREAAPAH